MSERQLRCQSAEWDDFCETCYPLEHHCHVWCPEVPFSVFLLFHCFAFFNLKNLWSDTVVLLSALHRRCSETLLILCSKSAWVSLVKSGRNEMGHMNLDDLHNIMPHVIRDKCFQSMFTLIYVLSTETVRLLIIPQFTAGHEAILLQECDITTNMKAWDPLQYFH